MGLETVPVFILLLLSFASCLVGETVRNDYCKRVVSGISGHFMYCAVTNLMCMGMLWALSGFPTQASGYTIGLGALFGVLSTLALVLNMKALEIGPFSYTTVLTSFSVVITALSGFFFWGEELNGFKIAGIALMLVSLVLSVKKEESERKTSLRWFLYVMLATVAFAAIGLLQKIHQSSEYQGELMMFLIISFAAGYVLSQALYMGYRKKETSATKPQIRKWALWGILVISGICIAANNVLNTYLAGVMDSAVFYPLITGVGLILNILACLVIFREKLTRLQWVGVASGSLAAVLLCF